MFCFCHHSLSPLVESIPHEIAPRCPQAHLAKPPSFRFDSQSSIVLLRYFQPLSPPRQSLMPHPRLRPPARLASTCIDLPSSLEPFTETRLIWESLDVNVSLAEGGSRPMGQPAQYGVTPELLGSVTVLNAISSEEACFSHHECPAGRFCRWCMSSASPFISAVCHRLTDISAVQGAWL